MVLGKQTSFKYASSVLFVWRAARTSRREADAAALRSAAVRRVVTCMLLVMYADILAMRFRLEEKWNRMKSRNEIN